MTTVELSLRGLRLSAGGQTVLDGIDLDLPARRLTALMGPMGCGKSSLLKVLAGVAEPGVTWHCSRALYRGRPLGSGPLPTLISQRPRAPLGTEPPATVRCAEVLARIGSAAASGEALCIDEPTAGLPEAEADRVMQTLARRARRAAVLVVSHRAGEVRAYCDHVVLLGGGRLVAQAPAARFFGGGAGPHAAHFLRTGGLSLPRADTPATHLAPELRPLPAGIDPTPATRRQAGPVPVLTGRLALAYGQLGPDGRPQAAAFDAPRSRVLVVDGGSLAIWSPDGTSETLDWPDVQRAPDGDLAGLVMMCRRVLQLIEAGHPLTLLPETNLAGSAALLAGTLVGFGAAPDRACAITAAKLPQLHLGLRLEQLVWDLELALADAASDDVTMP